MATLGNSVLTLAEIARRTDPNGMPARMANQLTQSVPVTRDIPMVKSNRPTGHRITVVTGLPTIYLRRLNQGTLSSRGTTAQTTDSMSILDAWSTVDPDVLETGGDVAAARMKEGRLFVESMGQAAEGYLWYGNESDDEREFNGLTTRYDSLSGNVSDNVLSAGGSSNLCSIWLIGWSPDKIYGIYPKHSRVAGLEHKDHGLQVIQEDTDLGGTKLSAWTDQWCWKFGIAVEDWRYAVRICNIDISHALAISNTQELTDYATEITFLMMEAMHLVPELEACNPVFYMPRSAFIAFDKHALARTTDNIYRTEDHNGRPVTAFRGVPMKISDQLLYNETAVS